MTQPLRVGLVGAGGFARYHLSAMLNQQETTQVVAICEPSPAAYQKAADLFTAHGLAAPPRYADLPALLLNCAGKMDVVFIVTPHVYHYEQAAACMEAGLDVLIEKPMVMNAQEAQALIDVRDRTGRLLVVAFQGGLSPQIRHAVQLLRSGELGELLGISGTVWQDWNRANGDTWRTQPEMAGGGFLFDTGAHMLNTVCDLVGEDFVEVAAWLDNRGRPVDIMGSVMGRLASGALVTIHACGDTAPSCESEILIFCTRGMIRTGQWGERLEVRRYGRKRFAKVDLPTMKTAWQEFVRVYRGEIPNPCPPEVGLRMARLWDAIRLSADQRGMPVSALPLTTIKAAGA